MAPPGFRTLTAIVEIPKRTPLPEGRTKARDGLTACRPGVDDRRMGKYDPLAAYLSRQSEAEVRLTFRDIERIVAGFLPKAAREASWWHDGAGPAADAPQRRAWTSVRFRPEVDLKGEWVRFVRRNRGPETDP